MMSNTKSSVEEAMQSLKAIKNLVPYDFFQSFVGGISEIYLKLETLLDSSDSVKQQFLSDLASDALSPFASFTFKSEGLLKEDEFKALRSRISGEVTRNFQYFNNFFNKYPNLYVRIGTKDKLYRKCESIFEEKWGPWKGIQKISISNCRTFLDKQIRIVFRYNEGAGIRLLKSFYSPTGIYLYDNLERNQSDAESALLAGLAHNSSRYGAEKKIVRVFTLSPAKRNPNYASFEKSVTNACEKPLDFTPIFGLVKVPAAIPSFVSEASNLLSSSASSSSGSSGDASPSPSASPSTIDPHGQDIGPTVDVEFCLEAKGSIPNDLLGTLGDTMVDGVLFTSERRVQLADGEKLFGFHFLGLPLPKNPLPCCHDLDEKEEEMVEEHEKI